MVRACTAAQHRSITYTEVGPMQTLRASAVALPFVGLAAFVYALSLLVRAAR